jgi:di/tricarboxylate transporter
MTQAVPDPGALLDATLTAHGALTLAIAALAVALFLWNRLRVDVVGAIALTLIVLFGILDPRAAVSGFAHEATVTVALMFVLSAGLARTGAVHMVTVWVGRVAGRSELRLLLVIVGIVVPLSAFINNTAAVAIMLPMTVALAREIGAAPSRFLMPLSFGSQLGGTLTLIGTSTNLLVAGMILDLGLDRLRLFDITPPGLILAAVGLLYLLTVGRWLTPRREAGGDMLATYELRDYLTELTVRPDSPLVGRSLAEVRFADEYGCQIIRLKRAAGRVEYPTGSTLIRAGDVLLVEGKVQDIAEIGGRMGADVVGGTPDFQPDSAESGRLAEMLVPPRSHVVGSTLRRLGFRGRYGVRVIALQRHGHAIHQAIGQLPLEVGDVLLVQGDPAAVRQLHEQGELALLSALEIPTRRRRKMKIAVPIMVAVVALPAFNLTTILTSALAGVVAMFVTGCIKPDEAYEQMDWMVIVLLGTMIPLGLAMQQTGAAQWIAAALLPLTQPLGPYGTLAGIYLLTSGLTEALSNNAAAAVLTPIAVATALSLGLSPVPFVVAVMFAASNSFITPIGYQTNTFIYGPGGYRFSDFAKVGGPLALLLVVVATFVIPVFFPF